MGFGFKQPFSGGEALRDDPNNGCGGDYLLFSISTVINKEEITK